MYERWSKSEKAATKWAFEKANQREHAALIRQVQYLYVTAFIHRFLLHTSYFPLLTSKTPGPSGDRAHRYSAHLWVCDLQARQ